jgi:hypothetical protein
MVTIPMHLRCKTYIFRGEVNLSYDEEEMDDFLSQSGDSNPADHLNFTPLHIYGHSTNDQYAVPA